MEKPASLGERGLSIDDFVNWSPPQRLSSFATITVACVSVVVDR